MRRKKLSLPKPHLSPSAVTRYLLCPYSYYLQDVCGHRSTTSVFAIEGKKLHEVWEANNRHKASKGEDKNEDELVETWRDSWSDGKKEVPPDGWHDQNADVIDARGVTFIKKYRKNKAPAIIPVSTEHVEYQVTGRISGVPMLGYIDLRRKGTDTKVSRRSRDHKPPDVILDYKTVKSKKNEAHLEKDIQMGVYALLDGTPHVSHMQFVKNKDPKVESIQAARTPRSLENTARVVRGVAEAISAGVFPFCLPDSWKCQSKYCGVWQHCPQGGKR